MTAAEGFDEVDEWLVEAAVLTKEQAAVMGRGPVPVCPAVALVEAGLPPVLVLVGHDGQAGSWSEALAVGQLLASVCCDGSVGFVADGLVSDPEHVAGLGRPMHEVWARDPGAPIRQAVVVARVFSDGSWRSAALRFGVDDRGRVSWDDGSMVEWHPPPPGAVDGPLDLLGSMFASAQPDPAVRAATLDAAGDYGVLVKLG